MSYLVLARKWRPRIFSEVVGQDHITGTLRKAVEKNRVAHAYLFAGPRGCGKTTTARLLAKIINCENPQGAEPCNECPSCIAVNEGRHLDVIEIDGASNRGIDEIRDLREKLSYAPSQGGSKIYIIDEVHMLTPQAFNALLKTLEEPPSHVYLVFATTEPHRVPATILSRCQRFNFKRLELREIVMQIEKICAAEKIPHDGEAIMLIARRAEGSMRDAESLLDQCIAASDGAVNLELVRRVLGLVDSQLVTELLKHIAGRDRKGTLSIVDCAIDSGLDLEEFFLAYVEGLRNLLVLSIEGGTSKDYLDLSRGELEELGAIAKVLGTENLLYLFRAAVRGYRDLRSSGQPRYQLEALCTEAASWESAVELSDLIRKLDGIGGAGSSGAAGPSGTAPRGIEQQGSRHADSAGPDRTGSAEKRTSRPIASAPSGETKPQAPKSGAGKPAGAAFVDAGHAIPADATDEGDEMIAGERAEYETPVSAGAYARVDPSALARDDETGALSELGGREQWERFLAQIREAKLTLGIWLVAARVRRITGERIVFSFSPRDRFAREMILEEKNRRFLEFHLERFFGRKLLIEAGEESAEDVRAAPEDDRRASEPRTIDPELEEVAGGSRAIKRLIEELDGELYREKSNGQEASGK